MCQRCQKSASDVARYGPSKLIGIRKPNSAADPRAMSVYPEKSKKICSENASVTSQASPVPMEPSVAALKPRFAHGASRSASSTFFARPRPMSPSPSRARATSKWATVASDGTNCWKRLIGPAICVGKNAANTWNFEKLCTGTSPR